MAKSLPHALRERFVAQFGEQTTATFLRSCTSDRQPTLRVNTLKTSESHVMERFRDDGIAFERIKDVPGAFLIKNRSSNELLEHNLAKDGLIYLQGIASMLPPLVLAPKPGERILDLCAAPGSKTTQIAALAQNSSNLTACEENDIRFQKLLHTIALQGAHVTPLHTDSTTLHYEHPEAFDAILADVPCSAEGRILLNDPRSFSFWSPRNASENAKLQRRLLRSAYRMLKPGGRMVYSTCTLAPEENERQIAWFIEEFPDMACSTPKISLSPQKSTPWGTIILPSAKNEGFFVSLLEKAQK